MRKYTAVRTMKSMAVFLLLLLLFPYVVSVFVNGAGTAAGDDPFCIRVRVAPEEGEQVTAEVEWTDYLAGILALEMPEDCGDAAAEAMAVLIRTRLYRDAEDSGNPVPEAPFLTREEMQKQWGTDHWKETYEKYVRAVENTDGCVLMYDGGYAWTPYFLSCSGMTRSAAEVLGSSEYPYVDIRECPLDKEADEAIQTFTFSCRQIQELCRDFLVAADSGETAGQGYSAADLEILSDDSAGYVHEMRIGNTICTGDQFRDALSLPSSDFSITADQEDAQEVRITTVGKGHGLGMSIWTAEQMAEEGKTCEEILEFFFEGAELHRDIWAEEIFQYSKL